MNRRIEIYEGQSNNIKPGNERRKSIPMKLKRNDRIIHVISTDTMIEKETVLRIYLMIIIKP